MKYICLGFIDEKMWEHKSRSEQNMFIEECFAYDTELRTGGRFVGGEALQSARTGVLLRYQNGKVSVIDGPFAETKEQLGGILILEAMDLNHAINLMSKHPSLRMGGSWEIRPSNEQMNALYLEQNKQLH